MITMAQNAVISICNACSDLESIKIFAKLQNFSNAERSVLLSCFFIASTICLTNQFSL